MQDNLKTNISNKKRLYELQYVDIKIITIVYKGKSDYNVVTCIEN